VFVRGHLRRYAELLGEADGPLQMRYAALQEAAAPPDLTQTSIRPASLARGAAPRWPLVAVAVALVVAIAVWWALRSPAS
jgi:hypothetical protein